MGLFDGALEFAAAAYTATVNKAIADQNLAFQEKWNDINYKNQQEEQQYQRDLQKQIFEREDTSQQRAVNDLVAAGLNPALAAGNGAGAGATTASVVPMGTAPQNNFRMNPIAIDLDLMGTAKGIQEMRAMRQNIDYAERHDLPVGATPPGTLESWLISVLDPYGKDIANKIAGALGIKPKSPGTSGSAGAGERNGDSAYNPPSRGDFITSSGRPSKSRVTTLNKQIENEVVRALAGRPSMFDPNYYEDGKHDSWNSRRGYHKGSPSSYHTINGHVYRSYYSPKTKGYHFERYY